MRLRFARDSPAACFRGDLRAAFDLMHQPAKDRLLAIKHKRRIPLVSLLTNPPVGREAEMAHAVNHPLVVIGSIAHRPQEEACEVVAMGIKHLEGNLGHFFEPFGKDELEGIQPTCFVDGVVKLNSRAVNVAKAAKFLGCHLHEEICHCGQGVWTMKSHEQTKHGFQNVKLRNFSGIWPIGVPSRSIGLIFSLVFCASRLDVCNSSFMVRP